MPVDRKGDEKVTVGDFVISHDTSHSPNCVVDLYPDDAGVILRSPSVGGIHRRGGCLGLCSEGPVAGLLP